MNTHAKILFRYESHILDEIVVETMWGEIIDESKGIYKLDSIPFYGPLIAPGDVFFAEFDEDEECLTYRETLEHSGSSVVVVVLTDESVEINAIRNQFSAMGCISELVNDSYFSMEIPKDIDYSPVQKQLYELEESEVADFAEPCLSEKHSNDIEL